jgi:hypothetical protein
LTSSVGFGWLAHLAVAVVIARLVRCINESANQERATGA